MTSFSPSADVYVDRTHVLSVGEIVYDEQKVPLPCVVKERTADGARIEVETPYNLPMKFVLFIESADFTSECKIVWRDPNEVGVQFLTTTANTGTGESPVFAVRTPKKAAQAKETPPAQPAAVSAEKSNAPGRNAPPPAQNDSSLARQAAPKERQPAPSVLQPAPHAQLVRPSPKDLKASGPILIADDDPDDRLMILDAFKECKESPKIELVRDGQELLDYLNGKEEHFGKPWPSLILLDLNMPRMDGRMALVKLKAHPAWRSIPVTILTTSKADVDIERTYGLGASTYIQKPSTYSELVDMAQTLVKFKSTYAIVEPDTG